MKSFTYVIFVVAVAVLNQCSSNVYAIRDTTKEMNEENHINENIVNDNKDENEIMIHVKKKFIDRKLRKGRTRTITKPGGTTRRKHHRNRRRIVDATII